MSSPHRPHRPALLSSQTSYPAELAPPRPRHRERTVSLISLPSGKSRILLDFPKAEPAVVTPHILPSHSAYGSFTPTPSARTGLDHLNRSSAQWNTLSFRGLPQRLRTRSHLWPDDDDSPLSSGTSSPTVPSFSRTSSPGRVSSLPMVSSATFHTLKEPRPRHVRSQSAQCSDLNPILARLERKSRLLTKKTSCATCGQVGSDFPKCGRCDAMWCSRECRMVGGKRHVCSTRTLKEQ